jgi:hypothetical protein
MKFIYVENNKQQLTFLLKFYWAFLFRSVIFTIPVVAFLFIFFNDKTTQTTSNFHYIIFEVISFIYLFVVRVWILYIVTSRPYTNFKIEWKIQPPKNCLDKKFIYPVTLNFLVYVLVGILLSFMFEQTFSAVPLITDIILLHVFIVNQWLPFRLEHFEWEDSEKSEFTAPE